MKVADHSTSKLARFLPVLIALCVFWAIGLSHLAVVPIVYDDEPWQASTAWKLAREGIFGSDLFTGYYGMERRYYGFLPLYPLTLALVFHFAESGLWQARFLSVACSALVLALTYALAQRLWRDPRKSSLAIFFLLTLRWFAETPLHPTGILFLDVARLARYDVLVPVFALGALHFLISAQRTERNLFFFVAGMLAGLAGLTHLYGLVMIPVLCVLVIWQARARWVVQCAWIFGGALVMWLPYFAYVLGDVALWRAQTRIYAPRFDLLNPNWYWENLAREATRYAIGFNQSPPLALRAGFWFVVSATPLGFVMLLKRAVLDQDARARFLLAPLVLLPLFFALLLQLKFTNYLFVVAPFAAVLIAWTFVTLWDEVKKYPWRKWAQLALVGLLLAIGIEATTRVIHLNALAATTTPYTELQARLRAMIPRGARVLGLPKYGFEQEAFEYRSALVPFMLANPALNENAIALDKALDAQQTDYIRTFACHFERSEKSRFAQRDFSQNRSK